jgi:hypothetical protein
MFPTTVAKAGYVELENVEPSQSNHPEGRPEYPAEAPIAPEYITIVPTGVSVLGETDVPFLQRDWPVVAPDRVSVTPSIFKPSCTLKLSLAIAL